MKELKVKITFKQGVLGTMTGDKEVYRFDISPISGDEFYGNDWHPNVYQDEKMAAELTAYLRSLMNWF